MKTDHILNLRPVGGDYFKLLYSRKSNKLLSNYLEMFNHEDYHILKGTNRQCIITYEDFLEFKYAYYIFFKKDLYDIEHIKLWLEFSLKLKLGGVMYLVKPFPPFNPNEKIKIIK